MHSSLVRLQNAFGYFTSVAFAVAAVIAVSVVLSPQAPSASLELKNVRVAKGRPHYYSSKREEYAHVTFDLDADLSSLFNWNTKQVFLYIVASYPGDSSSSGSGAKPSPPSEAVIWDAIVPAADAPFHPNTYVHPTASSSASSAGAKKKAKKSKSASAREGKGTGSANRSFPPGTKPGIVRLSGQRPKYQITDVTGKMAMRENATLSLRWNVQPWVGFLTWTNRETYGRWQGLQGGTSKGFDFPAVLGTGGSQTVGKEELRTATGGERNRGSPA